VTNFASADWIEQQGGLGEWEVSWSGFYDAADNDYGEQMADNVGSAMVLSIYGGDADAIGDVGMLFGEGKLETTEIPIAVADLVRANGSLKGSGRPGPFGVLLHPHGDETGTGVESSHNNTAESLFGGIANLHVTAITGSWTIKVQHSTDNTTWVDLVTFTQVTQAGGVTAESKTVTGTVRQYLRVTSTEDVAGTITFACGFARYAS